MTDQPVFNYGYGYPQNNPAEEPYFAAGTHRLPQTPINIPSTQQIEQDIDESIQQYPSNLELNFNPSNNITQSLDDFSSLELSLEFEPWLDSVSTPASAPAIQAPTFHAEVDFIAGPPKRVDSGLRATAKVFVPNQQWEGQTMPWTPQNSSSLAVQPRRNRMSHMPRLQTNMDSIYQTPPMSAPSRSEAHGAQQLSTSPLISLTDDACVTSYPNSNAHGYQWPFGTPPSLDINTWSQGTREFVDPARLTPITPVTPTYGGSSLERTNSRTSRTSRTTAGPYTCNAEGCGKEFRSKQEFSHHKRNHGERHHKCIKCPKTFVFHKDLVRHDKVHTNERYMFGDVVEGCQWCAKGFQRRDHYERHMKTHAGKNDALTPAGSSPSMSRSHSRQ